MKCRLCGRESRDARRKRCNSCNTKIRRYRTKVAAIKYLGGKCTVCGWSGDVAGFEFHHKNDKEFNIGSAANKSWGNIKKELGKCMLFCATCHRIKHSNHTSTKFLDEVSSYQGRLLE
jgi:hypothetical protein